MKISYSEVLSILLLVFFFKSDPPLDPSKALNSNLPNQAFPLLFHSITAVHPSLHC